MAKGVTLACPECIKADPSYEGRWVLDPKAPGLCSSVLYHYGKSYQMVPMETLKTDKV